MVSNLQVTENMLHKQKRGRLTSFLFIVISLKLLDTLLEETKVYATICALFYKMRMLVEVMCFRVLKNKISAIFQNLLFENQIWNSW